MGRGQVPGRCRSSLSPSPPSPSLSVLPAPPTHTLLPLCSQSCVCLRCSAHSLCSWETSSQQYVPGGIAQTDPLGPSSKFWGGILTSRPGSSQGLPGARVLWLGAWRLGTSCIRASEAGVGTPGATGGKESCRAQGGHRGAVPTGNSGECTLQVPCFFLTRLFIHYRLIELPLCARHRSRAWRYVSAQNKGNPHLR